MKIFIAGGTGFIGLAVIRRFLAAGHEITVLVRTAGKERLLPKGVKVIYGTPLEEGTWRASLNQAELIINLAGSNIFRKWTAQAKKMIRESRILATRTLVEAIAPEPGKKTTFINASATGYYGFDGDEKKDETAPAGTDFLARVCAEWEREAFRAGEKGVRVIAARFGIVLGREGGALQKMLPGFRMGVAGQLGDGSQWFPWIHIDDLTAGLLFLTEHEAISGPVNFSAPYPVRNRDLTKELAAILHRPAILSVPRFVLKATLGEFADVLLEGNRMVPAVLEQNGFRFQFPELRHALLNLLDA